MKSTGEGAAQMRLRSVALPDARMVVVPTPRCSDSARVLQCVELTGLSFSVACKMRHFISAVIVAGGHCAARPCAAHRCRRRGSARATSQPGAGPAQTRWRCPCSADSLQRAAPRAPVATLTDLASGTSEYADHGKFYTFTRTSLVALSSRIREGGHMLRFDENPKDQIQGHHRCQ